MRIVCWQTILMKYHILFFRKLGKMLQNLMSAAVVIGALNVNIYKVLTTCVYLVGLLDSYETGDYLSSQGLGSGHCHIDYIYIL